MTPNNMASMSLQPSIGHVSIMCLQSSTIEVLSMLLNPEKLLPSDEGLQRDWRGLAQIAEISTQKITQISKSTNQMHEVLVSWMTRTLGEFQSALQKIDRWDVLDDTAALFVKDAEVFIEAERKGIKHVPALTSEVKEDFITIDDVVRFKNGEGPQIYDAFLLYVDEDVDFATEVCKRMEEYNLKMCVKDRDFLGGLSVELEVMRRMICNRCNRLVVVISQEFLQSESMKFYLNFAQSLGIEMQKRKVVPVIYKALKEKPIELSYYTSLYYNKSNGRRMMYNFWEKLRDSIDSSYAVTTRSTEVLDRLPEAQLQREATPERTAPGLTELIERAEKMDIVPHSASPTTQSPVSSDLQPPSPNNSECEKRSSKFFKRFKNYTKGLTKGRKKKTYVAGLTAH